MDSFSHLEKDVTTPDSYSPEELTRWTTLMETCSRTLYDLCMETTFKFQILTRLKKTLGLAITQSSQSWSYFVNSNISSKKKTDDYKAMRFPEPRARVISLAVTTGQSREVDTVTSVCRAGTGPERWREWVRAEAGTSLPSFALNSAHLFSQTYSAGLLMSTAVTADCCSTRISR